MIIPFIVVFFLILSLQILLIQPFHVNHRSGFIQRRNQYHYYSSKPPPTTKTSVPNLDDLIELTTRPPPNGLIPTNQTQTLYSLYFATFLALPLMSQIFPLLLEKITDFSLNPSERQVWIISFLFSKRIYLYFIAITGILMSVNTKDSFQLFQLSLGQRYKRLNDKLFGFLSSNSTEGESITDSPEMNNLYQQLDTMQDSKQAIFLPIILLGSLVTGYLFSRGNLVQFPLSTVTYPPIINSIPTVAVSLLFSKLQVTNIIESLIPKGKINISFVSTILSFLLVIASFYFPPVTWPLRNIINLFIVMTISELFQLQQLPGILLALIGLTAYDVFGVYGSQTFTDDGQSIMEAVVKAKIAVGNAVPSSDTAGLTNGATQQGITQLFRLWNPGLFEVVVNNRITDGLGLGDVIFPSLLLRWTKYFDFLNQTDDSQIEEENSKPQQTNLYRAGIGGYVIGLIMCDVFQTGSGQPALLFIVPSMLLSLGISVLTSKLTLERLWKA